MRHKVILLAMFALLLLILAGCETEAEQISTSKESIPSAESRESSIIKDEPEDDEQRATADSYKKLFLEQPLPLWMMRSLEERGIEYKVENENWIWAQESSSNITNKYRVQFDLVISMGETNATIEGLTTDYLRYDGANSYRTWATRYSVWVDDRFLLAAIGTTLHIYEIKDGRIESAGAIDYSQYMGEDMLISPSYFQELEGVGKLLAVTVREQSFDHMTVLSVLDDAFVPNTQTMVEKYDGLNWADLSEERSYYDVKPAGENGVIVLEPNNRSINGWNRAPAEDNGRNLFIQMRDGLPESCQQMKLIFDDAYRHDTEKNVMIYQKSGYPRFQRGEIVGTELQHLVLLETKEMLGGCFITSYDSVYNMKYLGSVLDNMSYTTWDDDRPLEEREPLYQMEQQGDGVICLNYPRDMVNIRLDTEKGSLALWTEYNTDILKEDGAGTVDATTDGRFQIWKARIMYGHESQSSSYIMYDRETGAIHDFGRLGGEYYTLHFMDDDHLAIVTIEEDYHNHSWEPEGNTMHEYLKNNIKQTVLVYNLKTGQMENPQLALEDIQDNCYIRAYTYDDVKQEHVLLIDSDAGLESDLWVNRSSDSGSGGDFYSLAIFNDSGELTKLIKTDIYQFYEAIFIYAPATVQMRNGRYWIFSPINKYTDASYLFDPEQGESEHAMNKEYYLRVVRKNIEQSRVREQENKLQHIHYLINDAYRNEVFTLNECKSFLQEYWQAAKGSGNLHYIDEFDLYLEIEPEATYGGETDEEADKEIKSHGLTTGYIRDEPDGANSNIMQTNWTYYNGASVMRDFAFLSIGEDNSYLFCVYTDNTIWFSSYDTGNRKLSSTYFDDRDEIPDDFKIYTGGKDAHLVFDGFALSWTQNGNTLIMSRNGQPAWTLTHNEGGIKIIPIH